MLYPVELMAEEKLRGHFKAGVCALAACPRAILAMVVIVPCTLFGAGFADIRAQAANGRTLHI